MTPEEFENELYALVLRANNAGVPLEKIAPPLTLTAMGIFIQMGGVDRAVDAFEKTIEAARVMKAETKFQRIIAELRKDDPTESSV